MDKEPILSEPSECVIIGDSHSRLQGINFIEKRIKNSHKKNIVVLETIIYTYHLLDDNGKLRPENVDKLINNLRESFRHGSKLPPSPENITNIMHILSSLKNINLLEELSLSIKRGEVAVYFPDAGEIGNNHIQDAEASYQAHLIQTQRAENYVNRYLQNNHNLTPQEKAAANRRAYTKLFRDIRLFLFLSKIIEENPNNCLIMALYGVDHSNILKNTLNLEHLQVSVEDITHISTIQENINIIINEQMKLLQKYININEYYIPLWKGALEHYMEIVLTTQTTKGFINGPVNELRGFQALSYDLPDFYKTISGQPISPDDERRMLNYANILRNVQRADLISGRNKHCYSPRHRENLPPESECLNERKRTEKKNALRGDEKTLVHQMTNKAQNRLREEWEKKYKSKLTTAKINIGQANASQSNWP